MSRSGLLAALRGGVLCSLLLSPSLYAFELDSSSGKLTLDQTPEKIVSFDLAQLDTLNALGVDVIGVPKSRYAGSLAKYQGYPVVGTLFEPDFELLKQMAPDLIISGSRSAPAVPRLAEIAPTVSFVLEPTNFMDSFHSSVRSLGKAWGKEAQAEARFAQLRDSIDSIREINKGKTAAFLFIIKDNIIAHAPGDRFSFAYEITGLNPVLPARTAQELSVGRPAAGTPEAKALAIKRAEDVAAIVAADPDWLIILDRGAINDGEKTAAGTLAKHPGLSQTTAYKQGRVYYADPNGWYVISGGLDNLSHIAQDLHEAMAGK